MPDFNTFRTNANLLDEVKRVKREVLINHTNRIVAKPATNIASTINTNQYPISLQDWNAHIKETLKVIRENFGCMKIEFPIERRESTFHTPAGKVDMVKLAIYPFERRRIRFWRN
jgi:transcriptional regulator of NAD metabolism